MSVKKKKLEEPMHKHKPTLDMAGGASDVLKKRKREEEDEEHSLTTASRTRVKRKRRRKSTIALSEVT